MATVKHSLNMDKPQVYEVRWEGLATGDVGDAASLPFASDKSIHVVGTFAGGTTVTLQGSNDAEPTPSVWSTLNDAQGNPLTFTSARIEQLVENPKFIRPSVAGGAADDVDVNLICKRTA